VLPCANNAPSSPAELRIDALVAGYVSLQLRNPIFEITSWDIAVIGAPVPEAAINEDGYLPTGERNVGTHGQRLQAEWEIHAVAQPAGMQKSP
jgi:hypothetical protein